MIHKNTTKRESDKIIYLNNARDESEIRKRKLKKLHKATNIINLNFERILIAKLKEL